MTRFRKWLIHKLGGITKEDIDKKPVKYNVQNIKLESLKAVHYVDDHLIFNYAQDDVEYFLKGILLNKLLTHIKPEYYWEQDGRQNRYIAKIELPSQYVKGVQDNVG